MSIARRTCVAVGLASSLVVAAPAPAVINDAKTIILTDNSGGSFFTVLELEAFSTGLNVAFNQLGGTAVASSAGFGGNPVDAIDGNKTAGCCGQLWHGNNANASLTITLPLALPVDTLKFFGRQGCCPERADNFNVQILDSGNNVVFNQNVVGAGTASAGGNGVVVPVGPQSASQPFAVGLQNATATFHQSNYGSVAQTIDGNADVGNGMAFFPNERSNTVIAYETAADISGPGELTFMINQAQFQGHAIQRFRLSATDADRALFANGLPAAGVEGPPGDTYANPGQFVVLNPNTLISAGGATMTVDANGIITVSGNNPFGDTYVISATSPLANVTGLRLEVLPGGDGFVGRSFGAPHNSNGNAVIHEFQAGFVPGGQIATRPSVELALGRATATFDQGGAFTIGAAVDGVMHGDNGWAIFGQQNQNQTAVFQTNEPIDADRLVFELMHGYNGAVAHKLQDFQLFYTTDANPTAADGSIEWIALNPSEATTGLDSTLAMINGSLIQVTGANTNGDNYQIIVDGRLENITGFRLDALVGANGTVGFTGSNGNIVLSEFRAFATLAVPEPATFGLLALGSLALLRRRRAV